MILSATTGQRTEDIFVALDAAAKHHHRKLTSVALNEALNDAIMLQSPPRIGTVLIPSMYVCTGVSIIS